jgi:hypothetical protein
MKVRVFNDVGELVYSQHGNSTPLVKQGEEESIIEALRAALSQAQEQPTCYADGPDPEMGREIREAQK